MDAAATTTPIERAYRRLLRSYPRQWRDANAAVLLGVLMDSAEARGAVRPTIREQANLVSHGLAERFRVASSLATRSLIASVALGGGLGYTFVYAVLYGWVRADFYNGTAIAGPMWFLPAWLLLVAAAITRQPTIRAAAVLAVIAVAIAVPVLRVGPFLFLPGVSAGYGGGSEPLHLEWGTPLQVLPAASANVCLVVMLALLTLIGRPRRRDVVIGGIVASAVFGLAFGAAVFASGWPNAMADSYAWTWPNESSSPAVGGAVALAVSALLGTGLVLRRKRPPMAALLGVAALLLVAGSAMLNLTPPVGAAL